MRARWLAPIAVALAGCTSILELDQFAPAGDTANVPDAAHPLEDAAATPTGSEADATTRDAADATRSTAGDTGSADDDVDAAGDGILDGGAPDGGPIVCPQRGGATFSPSQLPNLLIYGTPTVNGIPTVGQPISITAKVQNAGGAPTPDGIIIGVAYNLPGEQSAIELAYEDTDTESLLNGAYVLLTTNTANGWVPDAAGPITIVATADDVDRICESNEGDNSYAFTVTVAP